MGEAAWARYAGEVNHPILGTRTRARLAGLLLASCAAGVLAYALRDDEPTAVRRTAISVACDRPADCALAEALAVDVWSEHRGAGLPLDVVVTQDALAELTAHGVRYDLLVEDIDAVAAAEHARVHGPAAQTADWFAEYRDYRAISERLLELAREAPDRASVHAIGSSVEGRTIWALRIRGNAPDGKRTKMLLDGTLHAREWIAAMTATCIADRAIRDASDPAMRRFLDGTELWIVPVANPDGYQYSWAGNRYWRKNRRGKHGVDLNRNFGVAWGGSGSSKSERSEVYRGAYAFSEPETAALRDLVKREQFSLHIDFHSYGQMLLYPWSYSGTPTKDHARYGALGDKMASAIQATHQHKYRLLNGVELYAASGTMTDWMYGEAGALSYTVELRPSSGRGLRGFVLPPEQIRPTCDEALAATQALRAGLR